MHAGPCGSHSGIFRGYAEKFYGIFIKFLSRIKIDRQADGIFVDLVGFSPNASMNVAHHMLLYGCTTPGSTEEVWDCGEMATVRQRGLKRASPCSKGSQVIYAWARDAPALNLPDGVAFKVGGSTLIQYLVLQIHYADVSTFTDGKVLSPLFHNVSSNPNWPPGGIKHFGVER